MRRSRYYHRGRIIRRRRRSSTVDPIGFLLALVGAAILFVVSVIVAIFQAIFQAIVYVAQALTDGVSFVVTHPVILGILVVVVMTLVFAWLRYRGRGNYKRNGSPSSDTETSTPELDGLEPASTDSPEFQIVLEGESIHYQLLKVPPGLPLESAAQDQETVDSEDIELTLQDVIAQINRRIQQPARKDFIRESRFVYKLDTNNEAWFNEVLEACRALARSGRIWQVSDQEETWDSKRNAGATTLVQRREIPATFKNPPYLIIDTEVFSIPLKESELFFMPDQIYLFGSGTYQAIGYDSIVATVSTTRFMEDGDVPHDAQIVGHTWQYVRKDGGPDLRFGTNRRITVVKYGELTLTAKSVLSIVLQASSLHAIEQFAQALSSRQSRHSDDGQTNQRKSAPEVEYEGRKSAYEILGIRTNASKDEIISAYRKMAHMYHPDKVALLAPEFRELAERRMKEINAAYAQLKERV